MATLSIYTTAVEHQSDKPYELFMILSELTNGLFDDITENSIGDYTIADKKAAILYIIYAYSKESPYVIHGQGSENAKKLVAEKVQLPDYHIQDVCGLKNNVIRQVIMKYLDFQMDRDFQHYMMKRTLYDDMLKMTVTGMQKEDGRPDFKGIVDANKYMDELLQNIKSYEGEMRKDYMWKEENEVELKAIEESFKKPPTSLGIEHNPELRKM